MTAMTPGGGATASPPAQPDVAGTGAAGNAAEAAAAGETVAGEAAASQAAAAPGRPWPTRAAALLRRHWLVSLLLAAGLALRLAALAAYHPALIYVDSLKYLYGASPGSEPLGYTALLRAVLLGGDLGTVVVIQHLAGLAMGVTIYAVLLRRGAGRWLAAVAAAPVLLDAYQVQMEQMIMPDVWFEVAIVAALALMLWRPAVTVPVAVAAGVLLGASATFKQLGVVLVLPAVLYLLIAGAGSRRSLAAAAALAAAFALPVLGYCSFSYARTGHFWLAHKQTLTGRLVAAADCATLNIPADVRALCPPPAQQRLGPDYLEHSRSSLITAPIPAGAARAKLIGQLTLAVETQQPLRVAGAIVRDSARLFALTRDDTPGVTPISRWQFQTHYPVFPPWVAVGPGQGIVVGVQYKLFGPFHFSTLKPAYGGPAQVDRPAAAFLRSYQRGGGYTPGPLLALFVLTGLAGSLLVLTGRGGASRQLAQACLLFTVTAAAVLLPPDVYEFSWRYQLPAVITLVPAGVLGIAALARRWQERRSPASPEGNADPPVSPGTPEAPETPASAAAG
ncbi:MAG TPA: hypothetical protein VIX86_18755 [Streptosporangiaceae bacterium]